MWLIAFPSFRIHFLPYLYLISIKKRTACLIFATNWYGVYLSERYNFPYKLCIKFSTATSLLETQKKIQFLLAYFFMVLGIFISDFPLIFINVLFIQALHRGKQCCALLILLLWTGYNIFSKASTLIDFKVSVNVGKSSCHTLRGMFSIVRRPWSYWTMGHSDSNYAPSLPHSGNVSGP